MNRIIIFTVFILCSATIAIAETYTWIDGQGTVTFTDNPDRIPSLTAPEVSDTIRIPNVQLKKTRKQDKKKLQATIPRNRVKSTVGGGFSSGGTMPRVSGKVVIERDNGSR